MATTITRENLEQETDNKMTVIDFWAPWCGPCKIMDSVFDAMEEEFGDRIHFGKMSVDNNEDIAKQYKVMGLPSIVLFKNGKAVEKVTGVYPKEKLAHYLNRKLEEI